MKTRSSFFILLLVLGVLGSSACKKEPVDVDLGPIELDCGAFASAMTLVDDPDREVDYYVSCVMDVDADIVVNAGVVIDFGQDAGINVRETGSFRAVGTAAAPITMKGETSAKGSWKGILYNANNTKNRLSYVNLSDAGGGSFNTNGDIASVIIWADTKLEIDHCTISNGGNYGISAIYTNTDWSLSNSEITTCANAPAIFLAPYLAALDGSNMFTGNTNDYLLIDLATQSITSNVTWRKATVPYRITSTFSFFTELTVDNATLTIEPGTNILFEASTGLMIDEDAALIAAGTASDPISFGGVVASPGSWSGIYVNASTLITNEISHASIQYAGAELDGEKAGILMRVNPTLSVSSVAFNDIDGCSIFNKDVMTNPNLTTTDLTHTNTAGTLCTE